METTCCDCKRLREIRGFPIWRICVFFVACGAYDVDNVTNFGTSLYDHKLQFQTQLYCIFPQVGGATWVHRPLLYCNPWRPTWLLMCRGPDNDVPEDGFLGLSPTVPLDSTWLAPLTQWEMLQSWEAAVFKEIFVKL
jgi:hypothetical protein